MSQTYSTKAHDCEMYWDLAKRGIEVVAGLAPWIRLLSEFGCKIQYWCNCDVVINESDYHKVGCGECCLATTLKNFSINAPMLEGVPTIHPEHLDSILITDSRIRQIIGQVKECLRYVFQL